MFQDIFLKTKGLYLVPPWAIAIEMTANTAKRTNISPMKAGNISWGIQRYHMDCAPLQYIRELTQNGIESFKGIDENQPKTVEWGVDPLWEEKNGSRKLCIIDNGIGMTGREVSEYINTIWSSGKDLGAGKNFGIGAKIAAAPLNPFGIEYWTWKDGVGYYSKLIYDDQSDDFGLEWLIDPETGGRVEWLEGIGERYKPQIIDQHGVKVVLLGKSDDDDTFIDHDADMPSRWVQYYLNSRYYNLPSDIGIYAPRMKQPNTIQKSKVLGLSACLMKHVKNETHKGKMNIRNGILHWMLLEESEVRRKHTTYDSSAQSGAIFQGEIYDHKRLAAHRSRMTSQFGLLFSYNRVAIFIEPKLDGLDTDGARTRLITKRKESLPWNEWGWEFKENMPDPIRELESELNEKARQRNDTELKNRIRNFNRENKLQKFKPEDSGEEEIDETDTRKHDTGSINTGNADLPDNSDSKNRKRDYSHYLKPKSKREASRQMSRPPDIQWRWISVEDGTREEGYLTDKAGEWIPSEKMLMINGDFRVWQGVLSQVKETTSDGDPKRDNRIENRCNMEYTWVLLETVLKSRLLNDNENWDRNQVENVMLSPQGLTAAVMCDDYLVNYLRRNMSQWLGKKNIPQLTV